MRFLKLIIVSLLFVGVSGAEDLNSSRDIVVVLETNQGNIELKMFPKIAPLAVENFTTHVKNGYYNGVTFHRVIKDFMIQGGDPTGTGRGGESIWHKEFVNEYAPNVVFDRPYLLAMANRGPNTNGSQFFITTKPTPWLNGGYTIFGEVIKGKDVVHKIENVKTSRGDRPVVEQKIIKAYIKDENRPK
jgi:peptidylprolyl isomerase